MSAHPPTALEQLFGGGTGGPMAPRKRRLTPCGSNTGLRVGSVWAMRRRPAANSLRLQARRPSRNQDQGSRQPAEVSQLLRGLGSTLNGGVESDIVGPVDESAEAHRARHPKPRPHCARCQWLQWGPQWKRRQGSCLVERNRRDERIEWVAERSTPLGGQWGLGCLVCAHAMAKLGKESSLRAQGCKARICTKWAQFEVRPSSLQASHLSQHSSVRSHKLALSIYLSPDVPVHEILQDATDMAESELFQGSVPQPADWLRAWRSLVEGTSFRESSRRCHTESFIAGLGSVAPSRQAIISLQRIIVECMREEKRRVIKQAAYIALAVDDRCPHKLLRFRCDHGDSFKEGVFGVLYRGGGGVTPAVETWDDDFCEREAESIMRVMREFCTSLTLGFDEGIFRHLTACVRIYVVDGCSAALKTGRVLKHKHLPNLAFCLRDPAHAIRIAARDPLHAEERFGKFWKETFDSPHALVREVQHSDQVRAKLESCQERVREILGGQGAGLQSILKHMSAAKQRFESFASPARRYCLVLNALALLLAMLATDARKDRVTRERAENALERMTPSSIVIAGLTADYTAECLDFVRAFDQANIDPARIAGMRDYWSNRMQALFLNGYAALEPAPDAGTDRTYLQICMAQVVDMPVFHYNDKRHCLWSHGAAAQVKESMAHMAAVVQQMLDRVKVDLADTQIVCAFQVFDLAEWRRPNLSDARMCCLRKHFRTLCRCVGMDPLVGQEEFQRVLPAAIHAFGDKCTTEQSTKHQVEMPLEDTIVDNRVVWGGFLSSATLADCRVLPAVIRFYLAVLVGTPSVERGLGRLSSLLSEHCGPLSGDSAWWLLEGMLDSPPCEEDMFVPAKESACQWRPTDLGCACQRMWIELHGRRFLTMSKIRGRRAQAKGAKVTELAIQQGRRRAASALVKRALRSQNDLGARCFGGLLRADLCGDRLKKACRAVGTTKAMVNFTRRTDALQQKQEQEMDLRRRGVVWCPAPEARVARPKEVPGDCGVALQPRQISVVAVRTSPSFQVSPRSHVYILPSTWASVRIADVIITEDYRKLDICDTWDVAVLLVYAVGLGKTIVQERDWQGVRPELGPTVLRFRAQSRATNMIIVAGPHLQRHANTMAALRACVQGSQSKWSVVTEKPSSPPKTAQVHELDYLSQLRAFLLRQRRLHHHRQSNGTFGRSA